MKVIKRNGQVVEFNPEKIAIAIRKANKEVPETSRISEHLILAIVEEITEECSNSISNLSVEDIQDMVVYRLIKYSAAVVATNYIEYRYKRALVRKANTTDNAILSLLELANEEVKTENANKNPTIASTQRDYMAGEVSKDLTKRILLPKDVIEAHEKGIIHFHK